MRSALSSSLIVSRTRLSTVSDRAFPVAAACIWNSLHKHATSAPSVAFSSPVCRVIFSSSVIRSMNSAHALTLRCFWTHYHSWLTYLLTYQLVTVCRAQEATSMSWRQTTLNTACTRQTLSMIRRRKDGCRQTVQGQQLAVLRNAGFTSYTMTVLRHGNVKLVAGRCRRGYGYWKVQSMTDRACVFVLATKKSVRNVLMYILCRCQLAFLWR